MEGMTRLIGGEGQGSEQRVSEVGLWTACSTMVKVMENSKGAAESGAEAEAGVGEGAGAGAEARSPTIPNDASTALALAYVGTIDEGIFTTFTITLSTWTPIEYT